MTTVFTTVPAAYDYGYMVDTGRTYTSEVGTVFRELETNDHGRAVAFQLPRYRSGLHACAIKGSADAQRLGLP